MRSGCPLCGERVLIGGAPEATDWPAGGTTSIPQFEPSRGTAALWLGELALERWSGAFHENEIDAGGPVASRVRATHCLQDGAAGQGGHWIRNRVRRASRCKRSRNQASQASGQSTIPSSRLCLTRYPGPLAGRLENRLSSKIRLDRQRPQRSMGPGMRKKRKAQRSRGRQSLLKCRRLPDLRNRRTDTTSVISPALGGAAGPDKGSLAHVTLARKVPAEQIYATSPLSTHAKKVPVARARTIGRSWASASPISRWLYSRWTLKSVRRRPHARGGRRPNGAQENGGAGTRHRRVASARKLMGRGHRGMARGVARGELRDLLE